MRRRLISSKVSITWGHFLCPLPRSQRAPPAAAPRSGPSAHPAPPRLCSSLQVNTIPASFHDGLLLYVQAVTETLAHGGTVTDGVGITQRMWNRSFQGRGLEAARRGRLREPQPRARRWRPHTRLVPFPKVCPLPPGPPAPSPQLRQDVPRCIQPHSFPLLSACPFDVCLEGEQRQTIERWRQWGGVPEPLSTRSKHSHLPPCPRCGGIPEDRQQWRPGD